MIARGKWVVLDTETTGLGASAEVIQQVAVVDGDSGDVLLDTLVCPWNPIPKEATAVHGITNKMVANAPTFREVAPQLKELMIERWVWAYNADFDSRLLVQSGQYYDLERLPLVWRCAMKQYQRWRGHRRWVKLGEACVEMGIELSGAHSAVGDALATRELVLTMMKSEYRGAKRRL